MSKEITPKLIHDEVVKVTGETDRRTKAYIYGKFLLSASQVGVSVRKISKLSGLNIEHCKSLMARARTTGLIKGYTIYASDWFGKDGGIGFNMDIVVMQGLLERVSK